MSAPFAKLVDSERGVLPRRSSLSSLKRNTMPGIGEKLAVARAVLRVVSMSTGWALFFRNSSSRND
jgi:hypothetical protein